MEFCFPFFLGEEPSGRKPFDASGVDGGVSFDGSRNSLFKDLPSSPLFQFESERAIDSVDSVSVEANENAASEVGSQEESLVGSSESSFNSLNEAMRQSGRTDLMYPDMPALEEVPVVQESYDLGNSGDGNEPAECSIQLDDMLTEDYFSDWEDVEDRK